ncbi:type IV pilus biogenesis/stability protein PilW [Undibacterium sp. TS12]|uniref:type IV pilus biogenesis/stability protein PilW n=1 Tax=Undibacterium sp. TS12 TaxID=2908202 RepID=UPI001F4C66DE|nr:type IV pilus biogenesis/stability protein PilW [Undibacterium sp. TS12]
MKIFQMRYRFLTGVLIAFLALTLSACASKRLEGERQEDNISAEKQEAQKRAAIRMQLAIGYYQQGQFKVALEEIRQALLIAPDMVDAFSLRALIFMDMSEKQLAEENFLHALKLSPGNADISNNYGWFLCLNGREKQGLVYLDKAIKDPNYSAPGKALNNAGLCSLRLKDPAGAERFFMQGLREEPANPAINANLAKILFDRNEYTQARFYINRVLKYDVLAADVLWLAIRIEKKMGDEAAVVSLGTQLRRRHPNSKEYSLYQRGVFDE